MLTKQIDWAAIEEKAKGMTTQALHYAILDIQKTLPSADALDRETGEDRGGYYRDEASIYHRELAKR